MNVKFVNLADQYHAMACEIKNALFDVISSGSFVGAESFEEKFAEYIGVKYCVGVGSGTDALLLSLLALGIGPGDEVIVPANTYIATAFAVSHTGATPIFIDPDPYTYVITEAGVRKAITKRTKAVIPVHLYGYPVNMLGINSVAKENGLYVIEDCAQSTGATLFGKKTGAFGSIGAFSFYPTKNLGGIGQGGAITTNNMLIAEKVRELGNVGRTTGSWFDYSHIGFNSRLDKINAVFLELCLEHLDEWNAKRNVIANLYSDELASVFGLLTPPRSTDIREHVYHIYSVVCLTENERDGLKTYMSNCGIDCAIHYPRVCTEQPMYSNETCPISEGLARRSLSLPMHPTMANQEASYVCECVKRFFD